MNQTVPVAPVEWKEFLEEHPPGSQEKLVLNLGEMRAGRWAFSTPELELPCDDKACNGRRLFFCDDEWGDKTATLRYKCKNCETSIKWFFVLRQIMGDEGEGEAIKVGEYPWYGPRLPSRLLKILGSDGEWFVSGRRCESQGLGIGAFAYYRRVVEKQKDHLFDEIIAVATKTGTSEARLKVLRAARDNFQFDKALDDFKDAIPESLRLDGGHNPLRVLHQALSKGLHNASDSECLGAARSVRLVLVDLAEKLTRALQDKTELDEAVRRLMGDK